MYHNIVLDLLFRFFRSLLFLQNGKPVDEAYQIATQTMVSNITAQPDAKEGIAAFLGKRHPHWTKPL
jgi:enoyl-CoA hydratase/carnithine racemase